MESLQNCAMLVESSTFRTYEPSWKPKWSDVICGMDDSDIKIVAAARARAHVS